MLLKTVRRSALSQLSGALFIERAVTDRLWLAGRASSFPGLGSRVAGVSVGLLAGSEVAGWVSGATVDFLSSVGAAD